MDKRTLTVTEAAQCLGLGRNTTYDLISKGKLPSVRLGRRILIPKDALDRLLSEAGQKPAGAGQA